MSFRIKKLSSVPVKPEVTEYIYYTCFKGHYNYKKNNTTDIWLWTNTSGTHG